MASGHVPVSEWLQRIRAEYQEMPGVSLNNVQMQRMWGLGPLVCDALVDALVLQARRSDAGCGGLCDEGPRRRLVYRRRTGIRARREAARPTTANTRSVKSCA
jgi:hypothetical protein